MSRIPRSGRHCLDSIVDPLKEAYLCVACFNNMVHR